MKIIRKDIDFFSRKTRCGAWLYLPQGIERPPVVVMAHGFAAEKDFRLPAFAEVFAQRGLSVFVFDYRNFGTSDGKPRNLVSPRRHRADWEAAIAYVRTLAEVDADRIGLWGTSFSGGHVIVTAAGDKKIRAVVSQIPFVDGVSSARLLGMKFILKATLAGMRDLFRVVTFRKPYTVPVVGEVDTFAIMNTPGAMEGFLSIAPKDSPWENRCPARILLSVSLYRPITAASKITCPVLYVIAQKDNLIPASRVERTAARTKKSEVVRLDVGHFEPYVGDVFERVVKIEADFFEKHLTR
jgi:dienelactone hydrolase